jgi:hypothetical protein
MLQRLHTHSYPAHNSLFLESIFQHVKCVHFTEKEKEQVRIAYRLASELHLNQERLNGKAYIEHIDRSIALYLNETLYMDEPCVPNNLIALILHDCIEDNQNGLVEITKKKFDIEITLDILWMSKPTASVIDQVWRLMHTHPNEFHELKGHGFLDIYKAIWKNDPDKLVRELIPDKRLSENMSTNLIALWNDFYRDKYNAQHDPKKQHKVYAEYMFLCMIAGMPRELFRIKATERRDNMQDTDGILVPNKVRSATTTMLTTMAIYVPRAREVEDDSLVRALINDRNIECAQFIAKWLIPSAISG